MCRVGVYALKFNWGALQASSLMCITDSLCDLYFMILFVSASLGAGHLNHSAAQAEKVLWNLRLPRCQ